MDPKTPIESRKQSRVVVTGQGMEGRPSLGHVESLRADGDGIHRESATLLTYCVSDLTVFHDASEIKARCKVCGGLMCGSLICAEVKCRECQMSACSADRVKTSAEGEPDEYLCRPCWDEAHRFDVLIVALVVGAVVAVVVVLFRVFG